MHRLPHPRHRHGARPGALRVISGESQTRREGTRPSSPSDRGSIMIGTPLARCMLVRTDSPGLLLVRLRAAGLRVAPHGEIRQGHLRVHAEEANDVRSIAARHDIRILEVHQLWLARQPQ